MKHFEGVVYLLGYHVNQWFVVVVAANVQRWLGVVEYARGNPHNENRVLDDATDLSIGDAMSSGAGVDDDAHKQL